MNDISAQLQDGDSEQRLRLALETGQIGLWVWNSTDLNSVGDWSNRLKSIFGMAPDTLVTHEIFLSCVHPEDREPVHQGIMQALAGERAGNYQADYRITRVDDGRERWVTARGKAFFDAMGQPVRFIGTAMDVTQRKRSEATLERQNSELERLVSKRTEDLAHSKAVLEKALAGKEQSEAELRSILQAVPTQVWSALPDGTMTFLNQRWVDYAGVAPGEGDAEDWQETLHPDDRHSFDDWWAAIRRSEVPGEAEGRMRGADGGYRWFLMRAVPVRDRRGTVLKWYGTNTDIDDRKRTEALLAGENRILEMLTTGVALDPILEALCHLGEELSGGARVSILLVSPDGRRLCHGASPSLPKAFTDAIDGLEIGPNAGSCGTAAFRRTSVFVADVLNDPQWAPYRDVANACRLRACWSTPIFSTARQVLGTFALYAAQPGMPSPGQCAVVEQFAHLASIAIERAHALEALSRSEAYLAQAQQLSRTGSFGWRVSTSEVRWSEETYCILGYPRDVVPSIERVLDRVHAQDAPMVKEALETAARDLSNFEFTHRIVLPDGTIKHAHVVSRVASRDDGEVEFVGAVMDITERVRIEEDLRASERFARGQAEALTRTLDALAKEPAADRIVEHVLRTITTQLDAHSCSVWLRAAAGTGMDFVYALEDGIFRTGNEGALPSTSSTVPIDAIWAWPEVVRTGKSMVLADIRQGADFPWRAELMRQGVISILIVPMLVAGEVTGVVGIRFTQARSFRSEEMDLAQALASQARLAVQLMQLAQQSRHAAVIAERNRMARDIHDTLAQGFTGVIVQSEAAEDALSKSLIREAGEHLERIAKLARDSLGEARRSVRALRPRALEEKDLCAAMAEMLARMTAGTTCVATFNVQGSAPLLPAEWEENLLRIVQEVLTNTLRHAAAGSFAVTMAFAPGEMILVMRDDGRGFKPQGNGGGFGLLGIGERVESMGGQLSIDSGPGRGTTLSVALPLLKDAQRSAG